VNMVVAVLMDLDTWFVNRWGDVVRRSLSKRVGGEEEPPHKFTSKIFLIWFFVVFSVFVVV
jgi:hypothetical protein